MDMARLLRRIGIIPQTRAQEPGAGFIPSRNATPMTAPAALRVAQVYRAISIITTAMDQLSLTARRGRDKAPIEILPSVLRRPNFTQTRREFIHALTVSLAVAGNLYIKVDRHNGEVEALTPLNPWECAPVVDPKTGVKRISYRGKEYQPGEIIHACFMQLPGQVIGLGPIQAAQAELTGVRDVRDYAANWFTNSGQPAGIITTDQKVTAEELRIMRNAWNYLDADGNPLDMAANPSRVRAIANGAKYTPILVAPKDAQWIEAQQFNTTQVARIFGIPAPLMLAAVEGNAQTYSNVEQEWIAFTRFTLAAYMNAIEDAITQALPRGMDVRFNVEALLRTDTKARYEAHKLALEMGLYSIEYARRIEGIDDDQL